MAKKNKKKSNKGKKSTKKSQTSNKSTIDVGFDFSKMPPPPSGANGGDLIKSLQSLQKSLDSSSYNYSTPPDNTGADGEIGSYTNRRAADTTQPELYPEDLIYPEPVKSKPWWKFW